MITLISSVSIGVYLLIFAVAQVSQFLQSEFINVSVFGPIYICSAFGLLVHTLTILFPESLQKSKAWLIFTVVANLGLASALIHYSGLNQSMFFFLYLLNIVAAGMLFQVRGTLLTAVGSSAVYNLIMILGPEIKAGTFLFLTVLNNVAFFVVAALSGYLAEQMQELGKELSHTVKKLSEYTQLASVIIDRMPLALVTVNSQGQVVRSNEQALQFFEKEKLENVKFTEVFPQVSSGEILWKNSKEESLNLIVRQAPLEISGVETGAVVLIENITKQRQMEYQLRQQEKMAAVGQLAAGIAHEIRNPLAGISGSVQMLSQNAQSDDDRKLFNIISKETDRLNNLITEFLDYSRPLGAPEEIVEVESVLNECLELMKLNQKIKHQVEVIYRPQGKCRIRAHKDKLKQAFLNIIINAYQAMEKSSKAQLQVTTEVMDSRVVVKIQDSGCGMPQKVRDRMFEPFLTTKVGGTGLGLAMTHKILENHKAIILVESREGLGTTFILSFPEVLYV